MSKHYRRTQFYGAGEFAGVNWNIYTGQYTTPWAELRDELAREYDLDPDALALTESYWGGEYGDDNGAELVTYENKLIGCYGRKLTDAEFALLLTIPYFGDVHKTTDAERATLSLKIEAE
jgi:hypothetical protein